MIALAHGGGTVEEPVAPERVDAPSISEDQVTRLAEIGRRLERITVLRRTSSGPLKATSSSCCRAVP